MPLTLEDLKPKSFKVTIKGIELESKPLRLSHALMISKIGGVFQDIKNASKQDIKQTEADFDEIIEELIPELKGIQLGLGDITDLIAQLMESIQPSDNKELQEQGVKFDEGPKA